MPIFFKRCFLIAPQYKSGSYAHIPYIYGNRAKTFQQGSGDTVIKFLDKKGLIVELPDVEGYMKYYKEHCPDN